MICEFLGKPIDYWIELDKDIKNMSASRMVSEIAELRHKLARCRTEVARAKQVDIRIPWGSFDLMTGFWSPNPHPTMSPLDQFKKDLQHGYVCKCGYSHGNCHCEK